MITDPPGRRGGVAATFERRDTRRSNNGPAGGPIRRAEEYADGERLTPVPTSRLTGDRLTPSAAGIVSARAGGAVFPRRETGARPHSAVPVGGGYLSRMPRCGVQRFRRVRLMRVLIGLSERRAVSAERMERAIEHAHGSLPRLGIGYVVVDTDRASTQLIAFARDALDLELVAVDGNQRLYRTAQRHDR
jgi:hypothetical protein